MKKIKYLLFLLILLPTVVFASEIRKDTIDVVINADGTATFTEKWEVPKQNDTVFYKDFFNIQGEEITDFKIVNKAGYEYKKVDKVDKNKRKEYQEIKRDISLSYKVILDTFKDDVYTVTYNVKGMIKKYSDDVYGIDHTFTGINYSMNISNVVINIKSEVPFMETNTALYGIGKEIALNFNDGSISFNRFKSDRTQLRLFTKFVDLTYENYVPVDKTFNEALAKAQDQSLYISYITNVVSMKVVIAIVIIVVVLIIIIVVASILAKHKKVREFVGIDVVNKKELAKIEDVPYYKEIPYYDLYRVGFFSAYFNIAKNRADLVGAFILKWIFDGAVDVFPNDSKPFIRLNYDTLMDETQLDKDLYGILRESSVHNIIDGSKLDRFATNHYLRVMTWFNMGVSNVITEEFVQGNIKRVNKMGKMHLELQEPIVNDATNLLGLKKYLLNFNQVPRETELTENTYKYMLIYAELFGIGELVAKEILRKNPNNVYAQKLLDLEKLRYIYKGFYYKAQELYKTINKNGLI
ncbi:MAG: DUF2207 domain-containing protein [Bacilli bacterium]|nr:DUF2207 domain-containing protein [Bacilli bacterium]